MPGGLRGPVSLVAARLVPRDRRPTSHVSRPGCPGESAALNVDTTSPQRLQLTNGLKVSSPTPRRRPRPPGPGDSGHGDSETPSERMSLRPADQRARAGGTTERTGGSPDPGCHLWSCRDPWLAAL